VNVGSIYLSTYSASERADVLLQALRVLASSQRPWILAGDFNQAPEVTMQIMQDLPSLPGTPSVIFPGLYTCRKFKQSETQEECGSIIDYMVLGGGAEGWPCSHMVVDRSSIFSPHSPVVVQVSSGPRELAKTWIKPRPSRQKSDRTASSRPE
jgi:endonuclease/exonuclease/phosphatase family metal-dependent hydrolase